MPINLIAQIQGVAVEGMTAVILAHDLDHAYTHLGCDIDGVRWASRSFAESAHALKEGLAQYYTWLLCSQLERYAPDSLGAYELLLEHQPIAYQVQREWTVDFRPEEVRQAMVEIRRHPTGSLYDLERALAVSRERLRGHSGYSSDNRVAVDILPALRVRYRPRLRPDLYAVRVVRVGGKLKLETGFRTSKGFSVPQVLDLESFGTPESMFTIKVPVSENARRFVDTLRPSDVELFTNLFVTEARASTSGF